MRLCWRELGMMSGLAYLAACSGTTSGGESTSSSSSGGTASSAGASSVGGSSSGGASSSRASSSGVVVSSSRAGSSSAGASSSSGGQAESQVAMGMVDSRGGVVAASGIALGIPESAVAGGTQVQIFSDVDNAAGFTQPLSPRFRFEPSGLTFAQPVLINIDVPDGVVGRLYWSTAGDENVLEPVGWAEFGKARAFVTHFSVGVVAGDGCTRTMNQDRCACRGSDQMDALCVNAPPDNCDAAGGWIGAAGNACNGYGQREDMVVRCMCTSPNGLLCSTPHALPAETCVDGNNVFLGQNGDSCYGYYMTQDANMVRYSQGTQGTMTSCAPVPNGTVWRLVSGTMANCSPSMPDYQTWMPPPNMPGGGMPMLEEPMTMSLPPMGVTCM